MSQDSLFGSALPDNLSDNEARQDFDRFRGTELFQSGADAPLAARMRPTSLDEVLGQGHLLDDGKPLRKLVEGRAQLCYLVWPTGNRENYHRVTDSCPNGPPFCWFVCPRFRG